MRSPFAGWIAATLVVGGVLVLGLRLDAALVALPEGVAAEELAPGERVFLRDCGGCHVLPGAASDVARSAGRVLGPGNRAGPTVEAIVRAYRDAYASPDSAAAGMIAFVRRPVPESSLLPDAPEDTWDRMAPLAISRGDLRAVVEWMQARVPPDAPAGSAPGDGTGTDSVPAAGGAGTAGDGVGGA